MITFKIEINGVEVKRVDITRINGKNEYMENNGYEYKVKIWDFENDKLEEKKIIHKRQDNEGVLLMKALKNNLWK